MIVILVKVLVRGKPVPFGRMASLGIYIGSNGRLSFTSDCLYDPKFFPLKLSGTHLSRPGVRVSGFLS